MTQERLKVICDLLNQGVSIREIGRRLGISNVRVGQLIARDLNKKKPSKAIYSIKKDATK